MQAVKRRFFAMRNGDLAAQIARGGIAYRINFGLNLPQIRDIAAQIVEGTLPDHPHAPADEERRELARMLWQNATTRESRLIVPFILNAGDIDLNEARSMVNEVNTVEVADVLCHRLLRNHPDAATIVITVMGNADATPIRRYTALRLMLNLMTIGKFSRDTASNLTDNELHRDCPLTSRLCHQIKDELE